MGIYDGAARFQAVTISYAHCERVGTMNLRTIKFFVIYDPLTKTIVSEIYRYRYQVPKPSKQSGLVVVPCKGFYVGKSGNV
jgi:hypothetical protein